MIDAPLASTRRAPSPRSASGDQQASTARVGREQHRRVELDELEITDGRAGAQRERDARPDGRTAGSSSPSTAPRVHRWRGVPNEPGHTGCLRGPPRRPGRPSPGHPAPPHATRRCGRHDERPTRARRAGGRRSRRRRRARSDAHCGRPPGYGEVTGRVAIEGEAVGGHALDGGGAVGQDRPDRRGIGVPGTCGEGVRGVRVEGVAPVPAYAAIPPWAYAVEVARGDGSIAPVPGGHDGHGQATFSGMQCRVRPATPAPTTTRSSTSIRHSVGRGFRPSVDNHLSQYARRVRSRPWTVTP